MAPLPLAFLFVLIKNMNKTIIVVAGLALLFGGGAGYLVGGSQTHPTESTESLQSNRSALATHTSATSMADDLNGKSGDTLDAAFLDGMIVHHQQAIDMAGIVLERTKRPEIKQMAQDIINAQTKEIETMEAWLKAWFGR